MILPTKPLKAEDASASIRELPQITAKFRVIRQRHKVSRFGVRFT
jgi:hypothetical protein